MQLREQRGPDACTELHSPSCPTLPREQAQEVRLAAAVGTDDPDRSPNRTSASNGATSPGDREATGAERHLPGSAPGDPHPDVLHVRLLGRLLALHEPLEACSAERAFDAQPSLYAALRFISLTISVRRWRSSS